jgi:hypothetical protein
MRSSQTKAEGERGRWGEGASKKNKDEPDEIATSSNQKTVSLLAMTDLVDEILTYSNNEGSIGRKRRGGEGGEID